MTFKELEELVVAWAQERDILDYSTPKAQLLKAMSELGELADAEIKDDHFGRADAVGDVIVCLIIYSAMRELNLTDCLAQAYEEIKNRKGRMVAGGAFVKEI